MLPLIIFAVIFLGIFTYLQARLAVFRAIRLSGPDPIVFVGNLLSFRRDPPHQVISRWTKQFGSLYGFYEGGKPILVTSDPNWVREVLVEKFGHFASRKLHPLVSLADSQRSSRVCLLFASGRCWSRLRRLVGPTVSQTQVDKLSPLKFGCCEALLSRLDIECRTGGDFNIHQTFESFAAEFLLDCLFGPEDVNSAERKLLSAAVTQQCRRAAETQSSRPFSHLLVTLLPELRPIVRLGAKLSAVAICPPPQAVLAKLIRPTVERRQKEPSTDGHEDFLQLLLGAKISETAGGNLSTEEIVATAVLFLLSGVESTAASLAHLAFSLAENPSVQLKLQAELKRIDEGSCGDDILAALASLPYLNQVVNESFRLGPLGSPIVARHCVSPCLVRGQGVPEGLTVAVDVYSLHRRKDLWGDDAESFRPERFSSGLPRPMSFLPFGAGPRSCLGASLARAEINFGLLTLLSRYNIPPAQAKRNFPAQLPSEGVWLRLEKRSDEEKISSGP